MKYLVLTILACFWAATIRAQPVAVTSGEHDGFTRLVLEMDPALDWVLEDRTGIARFIVRGRPVEFDLSTAFDRIARTRLDRLVQNRSENGSELKLQLACPCNVKAFPYLDRYIVLDIRDPDIPRPPLAVDVPSRPAPISPPLPIERHSSLSPKAPAPFQSPERPTEIPESGPENRDSFPPVPSVDIAGEFTDIVDEARTQLLEQLTMASETGMVDLTGSADLEVQTETQTEPAQNVKGIAPAPPAPENTIQFSVSSIYDRDRRISAISENQGMQDCPDKTRLDIASWGGNASFADTLARLRGDLVLEFDRTDPEVAARIVRLYIRYGFGREALAYLADYAEVIPDAALLAEAANIVEGREIPPDGILSRAVGCSGLAGLWAVVGTQDTSRITGDSATSIVAALAELPADLRSIFGPRLYSVLVSAGLPELALRSSEVLERAPGMDDPFQRLIRAGLARDRGDLEGAGKIYRDLISGRSPAAPRALIGLARMRLENNIAADKSFISDLGLAADELRDTPEGRDLRELEVLWIARLEGPMRALTRLSKTTGTDDPERFFARNVSAKVFSITLSDPAYLAENLSAVIRYGRMLGEPAENPDIFLQLSEAALNAGLPNIPIETLPPLADAGHEQASVLLASAYLQAFDPASALQALNETEGASAAALRVQALIALDYFEAALSEIENAPGAETFVVDPRWYGGDWIQAAQKNPAAARILGAYISESKADVSEADIGEISGPASLKWSRTVLEEGRALEKELSKILSD